MCRGVQCRHRPHALFPNPLHSPRHHSHPHPRAVSRITPSTPSNIRQRDCHHPTSPLMASTSPLPADASRMPSRRGFPPPCWSHDETLALIESYRNKWHSLLRANIRAAGWEEVAADLSRRSSLLPSATPKTSVQCRHKVEKLRKRFRSERLRSLTLRPHSPSTSSWPFFLIMESLDYPPHATLCNPASHSDNPDNSRTSPRLVSNGEGYRFTTPMAVRSKIVKPSSGGGKLKTEFAGTLVRPAMTENGRKPEQKRRDKWESEAVGGMVAAMRMVGDGLMRMEGVKMDMVRETERLRMEMKLKRTEMSLDSQQLIIDAFLKGVVGWRKRKTDKVSRES